MKCLVDLFKNNRKGSLLAVHGFEGETQFSVILEARDPRLE